MSDDEHHEERAEPRIVTVVPANIKLDPPQPFQFKKPDEWPRWRRRFEQFRVASGLAAQSEAQQVSMLLYCLGEEAEDVLTSTNITEEG